MLVPLLCCWDLFGGKIARARGASFESGATDGRTDRSADRLISDGGFEV